MAPHSENGTFTLGGNDDDRWRDCDTRGVILNNVSVAMSHH
jgi:hypothetical protein